MLNRLPSAAFALVLAAGSILVAGCASNRPLSAEFRAGTGPYTVTLDGDISDWPQDVAAAFDEHYLYLRFSVEGEATTLQNSNETLALMVDVDASRDTGRRSELVPFNELGVDLEVQLSPQDESGRVRQGLKVFAVDASGMRREIPWSDVDVSFSPTHAATWYEMRISRTPSGSAVLSVPGAGLFSSGRVAGAWAIMAPGGSIVGYADPFQVEMQPVCASGPRISDADLPKKPQNGVRVVNWNVLRNSPVSKPAEFRRILEALDPDVVIVQEWFEGDAAAMQGWFTANLRRDSGWHVVKASGDLSQGGGVAIISRFPAAAAVSSIITAPNPGSDSGRNSPVRFVAARIDTPLGVMSAASVHLKCCGGANTAEDLRRIEEARAIREAFATASADATIRLIAGDMNLVGTRPPLDILRASLDVDGSDLAIAPAAVLGDEAFFTWYEAGNTFSPGRLDYVTYSDASVTVVNAFVLDTRRLGAAALARIGLDASDSAASDHMPMVVDLVPR